MISKHRLCFHIKQVRSLYALSSVHSKSSVRRLQHIQNVPVRVLTGLQRSDYITPVPGSHHWLPVQYKMIVLIPKALYGLTPYYIFYLLTVQIPVRSLRSSAADLSTDRRLRSKCASVSVVLLFGTSLLLTWAHL